MGHVLTATVGLPASGKSRFARGISQACRHLDSVPPVLVSKDEIRLMLHDASHPEYQWNKKDEAVTWTTSQAIIRAALGWGRNVIVHDTNLSPKVLRGLSDLATECGAEFLVVSFLKVPVEVCIERDAQRTGFAHVGENVIRRMVRDNLENGKQEELETLIGELNERHALCPMP